MGIEYLVQHFIAAKNLHLRTLIFTSEWYSRSRLREDRKADCSAAYQNKCMSDSIFSHIVNGMAAALKE
jgi:hypothetical protein